MGLMIINKNGWSVEIDLNGGRIKRLEKDRQKILGTYERIDGKIGNTHICVPNFAAEGVEKFGYVFHGPFRNALWRLVCQSENRIEISCEIDSLLVNQIFEIGDDFNHKVQVRNVGNEKRYNIF